MRSSVARADVRSQSNPRREDLDGIRAGKANLRIDAKNAGISADSPSFRSMVREAMREVGLTNKAFAINADQSESVISEALSGTRHLSAEWVWAQDDVFWKALDDRIEAARGFTPEREDEIEEQQILMVIGALLKRRRRAVNE